MNRADLDVTVNTLLPFLYGISSGAMVAAVGEYRRKVRQHGPGVIEVMAIPKDAVPPMGALFDLEPAPDYAGMLSAFETFRFHHADKEYSFVEFEKLDQRVAQGIMNDGLIIRLFCVTLNEWGMGMFFRTGGNKTISRFLKRVRELGFHLPDMYRLRNSEGLISTLNEADVFTAVGWDYIQPIDRD